MSTNYNHEPTLLSVVVMMALLIILFSFSLPEIPEETYQCEEQNHE